MLENTLVVKTAGVVVGYRVFRERRVVFISEVCGERLPVPFPWRENYRRLTLSKKVQRLPKAETLRELCPVNDIPPHPATLAVVTVTENEEGWIFVGMPKAALEPIVFVLPRCLVGWDKNS
jgi:hypothetical protein